MHILLFFEAWWLLFIALSGTTLAQTGLFSMFAFFSLVAIPGLLSLLILRMHDLDFWTTLSLVVGFGILELMFIGLIENALLPLFGIARPLDKIILLSVLSIFIAAQIALSWTQVQPIKLTLKRYLFTDSLRDFILSLAPVFLVFFSIFGTTLLNNGGSNILIYLLLLLAALHASILLWQSERVNASTIATGLFFLALALLFMTSLRGSYVTGHDIQREFEVFQITKQAGLWSIEFFRDAYNACLSITILPTIFSNLTHLADPYIYKVFFQILFALVPGMLFLFIRRYVRPAIALTATLYFIAFPTFFSDMPFLNRQEIAFFFLFLMFLIISEEKLALFRRRALFLLFGLGMVLSHYSTTYTVVALLLIAAFLHPISQYLHRFIPRLKVFASSGIEFFRSREYTPPKITIIMALILALSSFLWSSVLTNTSENSIYRVIDQTVKVIRSGAGEMTRSNDVVYGLFSRRRASREELLVEFKENVALPRRAAAQPGIYFSDSVLDRYLIAPAPPPEMSLTLLGKVLQFSGVDVAAFNASIRESSAKILQILLLIGIIGVLFSKRFLLKTIDTEYMLLSGASLVMLVAIIVLPVLSVEYGLLRAFQQSLLFLSLFIVLGNLTLLRKAGEWVAIALSGTLAIVFLLSSTGAITQILGGYEPQLHLNNSGTYYDLYYMKRSEILGTEWLLNEMRRTGKIAYQSGLAVDTHTFLPRSLTDGIEVQKNIYPGLVRTQAFILVGPSVLKSGRASVIYNSDVVAYEYPLQFLEDNKNLIYSNGDVAVYR